MALPARTRVFWTLQVVGWIAFGVAMALSRVGRYPIDYMIATKAVLAASGLIVSLGMRMLYRRWLTDSTAINTMIVATVVTSFVASLPWTAFYNIVDAQIVRSLLDRPDFVIRGVGQLFGAALYHAFVLLAWSVLYIGVKRHEALVAERERALRMQAQANQARLQALRFQLQPHFLFNTLNALSTLIVEQRTADASRMLSRVSDFLRHTIAATDAEIVSLDQELEFARRYLEIEQVRFGDRLEVTMDVAEEVRDCRVPNLLLQPILENAVRHAIAPMAGGRIRLTGAKHGDTLWLAVEDSGSARGEGNGSHGNGSTGTAGGVGLANTRARLATIFGDRHRLTTRRTSDGGFRVEVEIPASAT